MTRVPKSTLTASCIGAVTILYLYEAFQLPFGAARMPDMGFVPVIGGVLVLGICVLLIGKDWIFPDQGKPKEGMEEGQSNLGNSRRPLLISLVLIVYPLILVPVGFIPSTTGLMFFCLWIMRFRGWFGSLVIALLATGFAHLLFAVLLHVPLPKGILD
jgi:putative tricarboxylic transport membrane protein